MSGAGDEAAGGIPGAAVEAAGDLLGAAVEDKTQQIFTMPSRPTGRFGGNDEIPVDEAIATEQVLTAVLHPIIQDLAEHCESTFFLAKFH